MLTATYTLVALSVEQASVRLSLQSLQKQLHNNSSHQPTLTSVQRDHAWEAMRRLYDTCHWRKIETFLIPAIRRVTHDADNLLLELETLNNMAADAMAEVAKQVAADSDEMTVPVNHFCNAVQSFCSALLGRLEREETELFPMARSVISGEAWFSIANQMLAHDAYVQENKAARPHGLDRAPARPRASRSRQGAYRASMAH